MKRLVSFVLSMVMMFSAFAPSVAAVENMGDINIILEQTEVAETQNTGTSEEQNSADAPALLSDSNIVIQGSCGQNVTYVLYSDGRMVISGSGPMTDYANTYGMPWYSYQETGAITSITVEEGITHIGNYAFSWCSYVTTVILPSTVTSIGIQAFKDCRSLTDINVTNTITSIGEYAFSYCGKIKSIELADEMTVIPYGMIQGCSSLTDIYYEGSKAQFDAITVQGNNENLSSVTIHYGKYDITVGDISNGTVSVEKAIATAGETVTVTAKPNTGYELSAIYVDGVAISGNTFTVTEDHTVTAEFTIKIDPDFVRMYYYNDEWNEISWVYATQGDSFDFIFTNGALKADFSNVIPLEKISMGYMTDAITVQTVTREEGFDAYRITYNETISGLLGSFVIADTDFEHNATISAPAGTPDIDVASLNMYRYNPWKSATEITVETLVGEKDNVFFTEGWFTKDDLAQDSSSVVNLDYIDVNYDSDFVKVTRETVEDGYETYCIEYLAEGNVKVIFEIGGMELVFKAEVTDPFIASGNCGDNLTYVITDTDQDGTGDYLVISGSGDMYDYEFINELPWSQYGPHEAAIETVVIEEGVTYIGSHAFCSCTYIKSVELPDSLTTIGEYAFTAINGIQSISIPVNVTTIGNYAFEGCTYLSRITLPESLTSVAYAAFRDSGVRIVNYEGTKASWQAIGIGANNSPLTSATINYGKFEVTVEPAENGTVTVNKAVATAGETITVTATPYDGYELSVIYVDGIEIDGNTFTVSADHTVTAEFTEIHTGPVVIDSGKCGTNVTWTLYDTDGNGTADHIVISGSGNMTNFGYRNPRPWEDYKSEIITAVVEEGVTSLGDYAFDYCENMTSVTIPEGITSIGYSVFYLCSSLEEIAIPSSVTSIDEEAFYGCTNLYNINYAGSASQWNAVEKLTDWDKGADSYTVNYDKFDITVEEAENGTVTVDKTVAAKGETVAVTATADENCELVAIYVDGTAIEGNTFIVTADHTVTAEFVNNGPAVIDSGVCGENATWTLYDTDYDGTGDYLVIGGSGAMGKYSMYNYPWNKYCREIKTLVIEDGVTSVEEYAFRGAYYIADVTIPSSLKTIGAYSFYDCALPSLTIPQGVESIGDYAFRGCGFATLDLPDSIKYIGTGAFTYCENLTEVTLREGITAIADHTFDDCDMLESIVIPAGVESIGNWAFRNCSSFKEITIPKTVISIGDNCFTSLTDVYYDGSKLMWNAIEKGEDNTALESATIHYAMYDITVKKPAKGTVTVDKAVAYPTEYVTITATPPANHIVDKIFVNGVEISGNTFKPTQDSEVTATFVTGGYCGDNAIWALYDSSHLVIRGYGEATNKGWEKYSSIIDRVTVCEGITYLPYYAFSSTAVETVSLPSTLTALPGYCFYDCQYLEEIVIPDTVGTIDSNVFSYCYRLKSVTLPANLEEIPYGMFWSCTALENIEIPATVEVIDNNAFNGCSGIETIELPQGLKTIGTQAFNDCIKLKNITLPNEITEIGSWAFGSTAIESIVIPDTVTTLSGHLFGDCKELKSVTIPDSIEIMEDSVFYNCSALESVYLPDSILVMGTYTFQSCKNLKEVKLPSDIARIPSYTFYDCRSLKELVVPDSVKYIDSSAFKNSTITEITLPEILKSIESEAFAYSWLNSVYYNGTEEQWNNVTIKESNTELLNADIYFAICEEHSWKHIAYTAYVCENCGAEKGITDSGSCGDNAQWTLYTDDTLVISGSGAMKNNRYEENAMDSKYRNFIEKVVVEEGITSIGDYAFHEFSNLIEVSLPSTLKSIGCCAFRNCSILEEIDIPDGVESIREQAFEGCKKLSSITLPSAITAISYQVFGYCESLTEITIPQKVTSIGSYAFAGCTNLSKVTIPATVTRMDSNVFSNTPELKTAGPIGSGCDMEFGWEKTIPSCAFDGSSLESIVIPDTIVSIESQAFYSCSELEKLVILANVNSVEASYLMYTPKLKTAGPIGSGCNIEFAWDKEIPAYAFYSSYIESITIPDGVTAIGGFAFNNCTNLSKVTIPASVQSMGIATFDSTTKLKTAGPIGSGCDIEFGWDKEIPTYAFYQTELESVTIPEGVEFIGGQAFCQSELLKSVTIPSTVREIGYGAFMNCSSLAEVTIPEGVQVIRNSTFYRCEQLASVTIPSTLKKLDCDTFTYCNSLTEVIIPEGVEEILDRAFGYCTALTTVTIPESVTTMPSLAFYDSTNIKDVYFGGSKQHFDKFDRSTFPAQAVIHYAKFAINTPTYEGFEITTDKATAVAGETVTVNATPHPCVKVDRVYVDGRAIDGYSFVVTGDHTITADYTIDHAELITIPGSDPTCTDFGNTDYIYCNACGKTISESQMISPKDHQREIIPAKEPTTEEVGYTEGEWCPECGEIFVQPMVVPAKLKTPTNLKASNDTFSGNIIITWDAVDNGYAYHVLRKTGVDGDWLDRDYVYTTEYREMDASAGVEYYYKVQAVDSNWNSFSDYSAEIKAIEKYAQPEITYIYTGSDGKVNVIWSMHMGNPPRFALYRATSADGIYKKVAEYDSYSMVDETAEPEKTYYYKVQAVGNIEEANSAFSEPVSITVPGSINPPSNLSVTNDVVTGKPIISWDPVDNADHYEVWRKYGMDGEWVNVETINATTFTDYGAENGRDFTYMVRAVGENTYSDFTQEVDIWCKYAQPKFKNIYATDVVEISWYEVEGAYDYTLYRSESLNGIYHFIDTLNSTTFFDYEVEPGKTYYYKVVAGGDGGAGAGANSAFSEALSITIPGNKLSAPTNVKATNVSSSGKIKLTWSAVESAEEYKVYRATSKTGTYTLMKTTTSTSYTNTSAKAGTTYYYKVVAVDANGNKSADSAIVSRTADLPKVTGVKVTTDVATGKPVISWNKVEGATGYKVMRSTAQNGTYTVMNTVKTTSMTNKNAVAGKTYFYKVMAVHSNTNANGAYSAIVNTVCDLPQVTGVKVTNDAATGKPKLTWNKVEGAVKYQVWRSTSKDGKYTLMSSVTTTSMINKNAVAGKTYYYKVMAVHSNTNANGAYSAVASRMCDLARPTVTVKIGTTGKPVISWNKVEGAVSYKVYRSTAQNGTYSLMGTYTGTTMTNKNAVKGKKYFYKVVAVHSNTNANSAYSTVVSVTSK